MNGDISRSTFRRSNQFSSVRMQQGRVLLDADWNEHVDIEQHREATFVSDLIGQSGAVGDSFALQPSVGSPDLFIQPGRFYIDGRVVELLEGEALQVHTQTAPDGTLSLSLDHPWIEGRPLSEGDLLWIEHDGDSLRAHVVTVSDDGLQVGIALDSGEIGAGETVALRRGASYVHQPYLPIPEFVSGEPPAVGLTPGRYLAYLEAFSRSVTALDRPSIREVALGGPDTTTRTQLAWQVRIAAIDEAAGSGKSWISCGGPPANWRTIVERVQGRLRARAHPEAPSALCDMPARAGYRRLENQLYRVEIHHGTGSPDGASFKWARDNASMAARWVSQDGDRLEVDFAGWDRFLGFQGGEFVELIDDERELHGRPGTLVPLLSVEDRVLIIDPALADGPTDRSAFGANPRIRRWDGTGEITMPAENDGYLPIEDGVEVQFEDGEEYRTGDYWLIPARTVTGDVEWRQNGSEPAFERPAGIDRHHAPLAVLEIGQGNDLISLTDVRPIFRPIVDEVAAVRRRNRFLHGSGVVCGLQVRCDSDREVVRVRPGYALAPDGSEIVLDSGRRVDVVAQARHRKYPIEERARIRLHVAPGRGGEADFDIELDDSEPESFIQRALKGTLLMDVWERCLRPAIEFLRSQFQGEEGGNQAATPAHRRQISAVNLLAQLVIPAATERVFISRSEHDILRELHASIRGFLVSSSFCGMDDDAPVYPDYPEAVEQVGARTAFGAGVGFLNPNRQTLMSTVRANEDGRLAAVFGDGPDVHLYDLRNAELLRSVQIDASASVQDVAFFELEGELRLLVAARRGADTLLTQHDARDLSPRGEPTVVSGIHLMRIMAGPDGDARMIGIVRGLGAVTFHPNDFSPDEMQKPFSSFNAVGHAEIVLVGEDALLVASEAAANASNDSYDRIRIVALGGRQGGSGAPVIIQLPQNRRGRDGFVVHAYEGGGPVNRARRLAGVLLCVVADAGSGGSDKTAFIFANALTGQGQAPAQVALGTNSPVSLSFAPDVESLLVVSQDRFEVRRIDLGSSQIDAEFAHPVQMVPTFITTNPNRNTPQVIVANQLSNTLTIVPAEAFGRRQSFPVDALREYRIEAIAAFRSLVMRFMQYVKDCACSLLYRTCSPCPEDNRLTLARITIVRGRVHHICLSPRKEVVTVEKLLYWASAIPVLPILTTLVKDFCCMILPDLVKRSSDREVAGQAVAGVSVDSQGQIVGAIEVARALSVADASRFAAANASRLGMAGMFMRSSVTDAVSRFVRASARPVEAGRVVNVETSSARDVLSSEGIEVVGVEDIRTVAGSEPLTRLFEIPTSLEAGDRVKLYTEDDRVVMVTRVKEEPAERVAALPAKESAPELAELRKSVADMKASYDKSLADREKEIKALRAQVDKLAKAGR